MLNSIFASFFHWASVLTRVDGFLFLFCDRSSRELLFWTCQLYLMSLISPAQTYSLVVLKSFPDLDACYAKVSISHLLYVNTLDTMIGFLVNIDNLAQLENYILNEMLFYH